jgi:hypothetical protein
MDVSGKDRRILALGRVQHLSICSLGFGVGVGVICSIFTGIGRYLYAKYKNRSLAHLKVHKIENFFGSEFEFYTISLLVMFKY